MLWLLLGKLPILLSNLWLTWVTAKRTGWFIATMATLIMWSTLSLGIYMFPSIIGALVIAIIAHTLTLRYFVPKQAGIPRHSAGALALAFGFILGIGRIGCWLSGCCFGTQFDGFWATQYEIGSRAQLHFQHLHITDSAQTLITVHPVQLYECLGVCLSLIVCLYFFSKRCLSETQASFTFAGLYFLLRAIIDPLRTEINTLTSLDQWSYLGINLSIFQWTCLVLALGCVAIVYLLRGRAIAQSTASLLTQSSWSLTLNSPKRLYQTWSIWAFSWLILWFSADYGTPFSHLLSLISAWGLAGLFLISFYSVAHTSVEQIFNNGNLVSRCRSSILPLSLCVFLMFGLASQNVSQVITHAYPNLSTEIIGPNPSLDDRNLDQAWVYTLDPLSKKRARVGRWGVIKHNTSFLNPTLKVTEHQLADDVIVIDQGNDGQGLQDNKDESTKSRLRLRLTGGSFEVSRESACGGTSVYHLQPVGGAIDLSIHQTKSSETFLSFSSFRFNDVDESTEDGTSFVHSARILYDGKNATGGLGLSIHKSDILPFLHLGYGFNTLTATQGSKVIFEAGIGSGLGDLNVDQIIGIYMAVKSRTRLGPQKDLILSITKPMFLQGSNVFIGTGLSYQSVEFLLQTNIGVDQGIMPALASVQYGF
jgi:prolipoprotein diacylglyceryltransferase